MTSETGVLSETIESLKSKDPSKTFVNPGRIAKICGVSRRSVNNWINSGKLVSFKTPGRHNRVRMSDFIDFLHKYCDNSQTASHM